MANEVDEQLGTDKPAIQENLERMTPEQFSKVSEIVKAEETRRGNDDFAKRVSHMPQREFDEMTSSLDG